MTELRFADRALQDTYRVLTRDGGASGHLDSAAWDQLAFGPIDQSRRDELFDHVVSCGSCAQVWRGVLALQKQAAETGLIAAPAARPSWQARIVPLGLAAALVLAVGSAILYRQGPESAPIDGAINRGTELPEMAGASFVSATREFNWTAVEGATQYRISVFTKDGQPAWTQTVATTAATWPDRTSIAPGSYTWRVEALAGGTLIARSRLIDVDITR
jgi:hypothetical protein